MTSLKSTLFFSVIMSLGLSCSDDEHSGHDNSPPSCEEDTRDEAYVAGISKTGPAGYTFKLIDSLPAPPAKDNNAWTIELKDSSGAPVTGRTFVSKPFMPDHGHGTPILPTISEDGTTGIYTLDPINLFMPGYWEITLTAVDEGSTDSPDDDIDLDTVMFKFCIEG